MLRMLAGAAVERLGDQLIGRIIVTARYGDWQGGKACVIELNPDKTAPEIVMTVKAVRTSRYDSRTNIGEEIGVFDHEEIGL